MPKTVGGIWRQVIEFDSLYAAFLRAQKRLKDVESVLRYRANLEENLVTLQNELIWHTWRPAPPRNFEVYEPKRRDIAAPAFRDRVAHQALVAAIEPHFERRFISASYACRAGMGTHAAVAKAQSMLREARAMWGDRVWVLKCDIKSYFRSIDHETLKGINRRTISDPDVLWMMDRIIDHGGEGDKGLDIGALTSQLEANVYADQLDHVIKDKWGVKYYARYMDDFVIISGEKERLRVMLWAIGDYVEKILKLRLNPKTGILAATQGLDFCGYRIWATHMLPRKRNTRRIHKRLRRMARLYASGQLDIQKAEQVIASYLGYMQHCQGFKTAAAFLEELVFSRGRQEA
ncbi:MAG: reverse transcriptase/maturase family protein [Synergistaceae bacterium]|nr:reverse transcriptase/maturase family protein [Synergistaceae bacterium]